MQNEIMCEWLFSCELLPPLPLLLLDPPTARKTSSGNFCSNLDSKMKIKPRFRVKASALNFLRLFLLLLFLPSEIFEKATRKSFIKIAFHMIINSGLVSLFFFF